MGTPIRVRVRGHAQVIAKVNHKFFPIFGGVITPLFITNGLFHWGHLDTIVGIWTLMEVIDYYAKEVL